MARHAGSARQERSTSPAMRMVQRGMPLTFMMLMPAAARAMACFRAARLYCHAL